VTPTVGAVAREGFDATRARSDAPLGGDEEAADLPGGRAVGPAAQLQRIVGHADGANALAVLLVEEGVCSRGDGIGHGLDRRRHGAVLAYYASHLVLDCSLLVRGQRPIARVVEAQVVRRDERPGLMRFGSDDVAQGAVQQVRGSVVPHRPGSPLRVNAGGDCLPHSDPAVQVAPMHDQPGDRLLGVFDGEELASAAGLEEFAAVADLPAALAVERSGVEDYLRLALAGQFLELHAVANDRNDPAFGLRPLIAEEAGFAGATLDLLVEIA